jgi:hypothetical protein
MTEKARVEWWFSAACAIPWLALASPYLGACVFRLTQSRWPRPMLDEPGQVWMSPFYPVFQLLFLLSFLAIPLPMFLALWNHHKVLHDRRYSSRVAVFAVGLAAVFVVFVIHYDPGSVYDWFFD